MDRDLVQRQIDDTLKNAGTLSEVSEGHLRIVNKVVPEIFDDLLLKADSEERLDLLYTYYMLSQRRIVIGVPIRNDNKLSIEKRIEVIPVLHEDGKSEVHIYFSESLLGSYDSADDRQVVLDRFRSVALESAQLCRDLIIVGKFKSAIDGIWRDPE